MSFIKGRGKITKYGRNPGGLVVYVKNITDQCVEEIVTKKSKQKKKLIGTNGTITINTLLMRD